MDREEFKRLLPTESPELDVNTSKIIKEGINLKSFDKNYYLISTMGELSKLTTSICEELHGFHDTYGMLENVADVCIRIKYLQELLNISQEELNKAMNVKIHELQRILKMVGIEV